MKLIDFFFPPKCACCGEILGADGRIELCRRCADSFAAEASAVCPKCGKHARDCRCHPIKYHDGSVMAETVFAYYYTSDMSRVGDRLIFRLKQKNDRSAARFLGRIMSEHLMRRLITDGVATDGLTVTFAPRSSEGLRKYGFDQSKRLAETVAGYLDADCVSLFRRRGGEVQKRLDRQGRECNAQSSIEIKNTAVKRGGVYIVVDDVITTGATAASVAEKLYEAGAARVIVLSAAKRG